MKIKFFPADKGVCVSARFYLDVSIPEILSRGGWYDSFENGFVGKMESFGIDAARWNISGTGIE
ncbi:MAG: hypothetical protein LBP64_08275 [Tannerella sp.]|jgi:hypothetical protein|nr:hypothetical protein [Tannerella sp.]